MEGITDPHHRETAGKFRGQRRSTEVRNALIKVINGFSKPDANDPEREDTYGGPRKPGMHQDRHTKGVPISRPNKPSQVDTC